MPNSPSKRGIQWEFAPYRNPSGMPEGQSWFLGIGIDNYKFTTSLQNAVKDVNDVLTLLQDRYVISKSITLFNEKATKQNIIDELESLSDNIGPADKLIIYYSGHGYLNRAKTSGYWIPVRGRAGQRGSLIRNDTILGCIRDIGSKHTLLISDSCFSGTFITRDVPNPGLALEELEKDRSRWVISSGRGTEVSSDGLPGKNSPFAESILKVLRDNRDRMLNLAIFADKVIKLTKYKSSIQMPQMASIVNAGHEGGQYIFYLKARAVGWQSEWEKIQKLSEVGPEALKEKIIRLDNYVERFRSAPNITAVIELGIYLEQKCEFWECQHSLFKLRRFATKPTSFQQEALQLIEEKKKKLLEKDPSSKGELEKKRDKPEKSSVSLVQDQLEKLFEIPPAKELSEKLAELPISDLRKAFTINTWIDFTRYLFSGDSEAFKSYLGQLNNYDSFAKAKILLREVAVHYNWLEKERQALAKEFIQTVRRRYLRDEIKKSSSSNTARKKVPDNKAGRSSTTTKKPKPKKQEEILPPKFNTLFEEIAPRSLSEKLSERPINDLTKALTINELLIYMNELFGKDLKVLKDSLSTLNQYQHLGEARGLLFNLAEQYDWMEEGRQSVARDFIKLVRRRYQ